MTRRKGRLIVWLLVFGFVVQGFLMPTTIEADNESGSLHSHWELVEWKAGYCRSFTITYSSGGYVEYCTFVYYAKYKVTSHGIASCTACGYQGDHWVSDSSCWAGGYYSCIQSGCYAN